MLSWGTPWPVMTSVEEQRILIRNSHGENLVGILHETCSKELVIICHGFQSKKERIPMVTLSTALGREGTSAFRFDFAGNGGSEGSFMYGNYRREAEDLRAVVEHFRDKERLITAIVGHSRGGNVVLLYASKYNDVSTVVNISGWFHLEKVDWVKISYKESSKLGILLLGIGKVAIVFCFIFPNVFMGTSVVPSK